MCEDMPFYFNAFNKENLLPIDLFIIYIYIYIERERERERERDVFTTLLQ